MNVRIVANALLALAALVAAGYVMARAPTFIPSLSAPGHGRLFAGPARILLLLGLFGLAAFAGAVARAWHRGDIPLPPPGTLRPDPDDRGRLMVRFWYLLLPLLAGLVGALLLSRRSAAPMPHDTAQSSLRASPGCAIVRARPCRTRA
jgi:hypothetical protein